MADMHYDNYELTKFTCDFAPIPAMEMELNERTRTTASRTPCRDTFSTVRGSTRTPRASSRWPCS